MAELQIGRNLHLPGYLLLLLTAGAGAANIADALCCALRWAGRADLRTTIKSASQSFKSFRVNRTRMRNNDGNDKHVYVPAVENRGGNGWGPLWWWW